MTKPEDLFFQYTQKHLGGGKFLDAEDLAVVLKAHLLLEMQLDKLLNLCIFHHKGQENLLEVLNLTFSKKVQLVSKQKLLASEIITLIWIVNDIRNKFAHNIEASFAEMSDLLDKFFPFFEDQLLRVTTSQYAEVNNNKKAKFGLCMYYLLGVLNPPDDK